MKKIEAIVRREALADIQSALEEAGYRGMTVTEVKGHGKQRGLAQQWRGQEYRIELLPKAKVELVVLDEDVGRIIAAIVRTARTGEIGDGKVFVSPIESAVRVRTGETGVDAI
ncbi:MAG: P-II family nitrogen regulator [Chloroflexi bacterium]|nr:P-II family nitrogen regulator [Chloroflexota bacterium]